MAEAIDCRPNTEELYTCANNTTNLRVEADSRGSADLLISAGWSASRLGAAMLRLHSEWDSVEKPPRPTKEFIEALAATYPAVAKVKGRADPRLAVAQQAATRWHLSEMYKLAGKLTVLPDVRREVVLQAARWRICDPENVAPAVIKYWLDQNCGACGGLKWKLVPGTPSLSNRQCHVCHGSGVGAVPHGQDGKRLCNFLDDCVSRAQQSIRMRLRNTK